MWEVYILVVHVELKTERMHTVVAIAGDRANERELGREAVDLELPENSYILAGGYHISAYVLASLVQCGQQYPARLSERYDLLFRREGSRMLAHAAKLGRGLTCCDGE